MILRALAVLLGCQLAGEAFARYLGIPIPGPVLGLILLLCLLAAAPKLVELLKPVTDVILQNLGLLFVPAAVGVIQHLGLLGSFGGPILLALAVSTLLALIVSAVAFVGLARITKNRSE